MHLNTQKCMPWKGRELEGNGFWRLTLSLWLPRLEPVWEKAQWGPRDRSQACHPTIKASTVSACSSLITLSTFEYLKVHSKYHLLIGCCMVNGCCSVEWLNEVFLFFFNMLLKVKLIKQVQTRGWTLGKRRLTMQKPGWKNFQGNT